MLHRRDGLKLPIAFIPNTENNDICETFSIESIDRALDYIIKGQLIFTDVLKVRLDHNENEE